MSNEKDKNSFLRTFFTRGKEFIHGEIVGAFVENVINNAPLAMGLLATLNLFNDNLGVQIKNWSELSESLRTVEIFHSDGMTIEYCQDLMDKLFSGATSKFYTNNASRQFLANDPEKGQIGVSFSTFSVDEKISYHRHQGNDEGARLPYAQRKLRVSLFDHPKQVEVQEHLYAPTTQLVEGVDSKVTSFEMVETIPYLTFLWARIPFGRETTLRVTSSEKQQLYSPRTKEEFLEIFSRLSTE